MCIALSHAADAQCSEEVFDFSKDQMTQAKIKGLKESFNHEFSQIFELCVFITSRSTKASLLHVTLETLLKFLNWIPVGYIFEDDKTNFKLIEMLTLRVPQPRAVSPGHDL